MTQEFLKYAFRVYRKNSFAVNTSLAACVAFTFASQYSAQNFLYGPNIPMDPEFEAPLSHDISHTSIAPDIPDTVRAAVTLPMGSGVEAPSFRYEDYNGVIAMTYHVNAALDLPAYVISDVTAKSFNVPKYKMDIPTMGAIYDASEKTGIPAGVLFAFASKESNFDRDAAAKTSSARGIFQHVKSTWRNTIKKLGPNYDGYSEYADQIAGKDNKTWFKSDASAKAILALRDDPQHSALMAAALLKDNMWRAEAELGRPLKINEYYITHFLGLSDSVSFINAYEKAPNAHVNTISALDQAIEKNKSVFVKKNGRHKTVREVMTWFDNEMGKRIAYFTLKYDRSNDKGMMSAVEFASARGLLEKIEPKRAETIFVSNTDHARTATTFSTK